VLDAEERTAVALLAAAGLLAGEAEESEPARAWEWHDLLFHAETRGWSDGRPRGGTYPLRGVLDPPRDARPFHDGRVVELERADLDALARSDVPFAAVLERRRSERRFDDPDPVTAFELGRLLHQAAARKSVFESEGIELSRRPAPSGGGLAALELYPVVYRCAGLDPGLYHYEADVHRLRRLADRPHELAGALAEAADPPQVLLLVFLRHARIAWKYERIAYQLALLDLGVLYQTLWLAATAMGLGGYPLGSVDADRLADAVGVNPLGETGLGAFLLGRPRAGAQ
jgi:SagB-type dehydrogenase family enzyme